MTHRLLELFTSAVLKTCCCFSSCASCCNLLQPLLLLCVWLSLLLHVNWLLLLALMITAQLLLSCV
jgi:hypothetical protein